MSFTYRGFEIGYYGMSHFWTGCPHWVATNDEGRGQGVKTLREAMELIDEIRADKVAILRDALDERLEELREGGSEDHAHFDAAYARRQIEGLYAELRELEEYGEP